MSEDTLRKTTVSLTISDTEGLNAQTELVFDPPLDTKEELLDVSPAQMVGLAVAQFLSELSDQGPDSPIWKGSKILN